MISVPIGKPSFFTVHLVFVLLTIVFCFPGSVSASAEEAAALFKWKSSFLNPDNPLLTSWILQQNSSPCSWYGVSCINGSVNRLNLSDSNINSTLYNFPFSSLPNLEYVDMAINEFSGRIPPQIGSIPKELGNLMLLDDLELSNNLLIGSVPVALGNLSNLKYLYLLHNQLSGPIPQELGNLTKLVAMIMAENQFSGQLPEGLCQGGVLKNLTVNENMLTGPIPRSLKNCSSLLRTIFYRNQLTGNLSEMFGVYPNLDYMDLSNNNFYGELSADWGRCQNLSTLKIAENNISGPIPPELGNLPQLGVLDLSSNRLTGEIPKEFGDLTSMLNLFLQENQLSGSIPQELGSLTQLLNLDLSANSLNGSIPRTLGNCQKLFQLNLSSNLLSQNIPIELGKFIQLSTLDLSHNFLVGEIPSVFGGLQSLEILNLSHNNLSGSIPDDLDALPGSTHVDLSFNDLEGPIPPGNVFKNLTVEQVKGNKGLCGNITGLQPCQSPPVEGTHKRHKVRRLVLIILLPLLGSTLLLCAFVGSFLLYERRKRTANAEDMDVDGDGFFSISVFDGRAMYRQILKATEVFNSTFCVGEGGYGSVYKVKLPSAEVVAVKRLHHSSEMTDRNGFLNEIRALTNIRHRNIVKLYGFCSNSKHSILVYEYLERGSLANILSKEAAARNLDWQKRVNIIKGVAFALSYMHHDCSPPIVHRDISSNNILLDSDYEAHVSDFGTAKLLKQDSSNWSALAGTYGYIAPEFAYTMEVTEKCDVYSFGILALEVIKGSYPGDYISQIIYPTPGNLQLKDLLDQRLSHPSREIEEVLISIIKIAKGCLVANPKSRPTMYIVSDMLSMGAPSPQHLAQTEDMIKIVEEDLEGQEH
ncbi:hypothetical protein ACH5RR_026844 [Cinchona calisaya]|uniref:non-specific serine/threonine protein kinase n=1 Tax=Cinchona calisaya TaxID=153742 RepID=A0ABD2Z7N0_9GENT